MADPTVQDVVVVGAGECGARAVAALREHDYRGRVTLIGAEELVPYERPPLSKAAIVATDEPEPTTILSYERLKKLDIDVGLGVSAIGIDRQRRLVELSDGRGVSYDRMLLATGARPRLLPISGGEHALTLRTFADAVALRQRFLPGARIGIIGAGFIGLELAAAARTRGCSVTVLEMAPTAMGRAVPAALAESITRRHVAEGVEIRCDAIIERIEALDDGSRRIVVGTTSGGAPGNVDCDVVIAGIGAQPNVELAATAGLDVDNGIAVDDHLRTSDPRIYAAGDCCSFPHDIFGGRRIRLEAWRNAQDQANHAVANLLGAAEPYRAIPWFWSDQYDLSLQIAGLPSVADREINRARDNGSVIRFGLDPEGHLVSAAGLATGNGIAKDIRLAEMMIAARCMPDPAALSDPGTNLKSLLRA